jgi:hypothetical protein
MKGRLGFLVVGFLSLSLFVSAQTPNSNSPAATPAVQVPRLIRFSGIARDASGKPLTSVVGITFCLYKDQQGGDPLWIETQNVQPDSSGHYTVLLGSTKSTGMPTELFTSGDARWLGVQAQGQNEEARVLMVSVPYALKAEDAETIGGLPPSAFVMANQTAGQSAKGNSNVAGTTIKTSSGSQPPPPCVNAGAAGRIAKFFAATCVNSSIMVQAANRIGVGVAAPTAKLDVDGSLNILATGSFNIGTQPFAFGSFANLNAFLGFAGNSTTTGIQNTATGAQAFLSNTNGGYNTANGYQALYSNTTASDNTAIGFQALYSNALSDNTAIGFQALYSNTSGDNTATGSQALYNNTAGGANTASGVQALYRNTTGNYNTATGELALFNNMSGIRNTASGYQALGSNSTGSYNTADGWLAMPNNTAGSNNTAIGRASLDSTTTGGANTAIGAGALYGNVTGTYNTALGYQAGPDANSTNLSNTTAIGWNATVSQSNALILGGSGAYAVNVGIGTATPDHVFTIAQGAGHAISDGWDTYSSRRWKTNIEILHGALAKVEQLRGVSYDLKESGKHEVGVIAEEVGAVVPEIVSWDKNGKDALGIDYSRLTALLIEATKEQQVLIHEQQSQIKAQQRQIKAQQIQIKAERTRSKARFARLTSQVEAIQASLKTNSGTDTEVRTAAVHAPAAVR